ncbi:hypothetical protein DXT98_01125 [Agrobacterium sp. ICMP 7243]|nr:hypothetical protein DXT98_01125 [Agrobacterium sp. ICMP 7243]
MTEVTPKVLEIVEHIKFDFAKATTEEYSQDVADEWADTGLSCRLTSKALRYSGVYQLMEQHGYKQW